ncbi:MAG TPA: tripartite tricarboxylate transporter substrate binding protein [Burkholderiales bacterium]|nr:tripartite tricarboxylate transporter substrate binding protein [Burkholderiales bacterium]
MRKICGIAIVLASWSAVAWAQPAAQRDYPTKAIRVVVPYAAGGPMDYIGRMLGRKMAPTLGQQLVIDNRPGAGGALGSDVVAKSAPDGYTMLHTSSSHASLPVITKSLPYDAVRDFAPVTLIVNSVGFLFVAHPAVPATSIKDFVAAAKARPGKITYGSGGIGNVMHFAAEIFNDKAGTQLTHVPYKGVGQAITDLLGGRIDTCFGPATALLPHIRSGKLKPLGITALHRWNELPDVPTIDEAGVKGYEFVPWYGLWFPAGTPQPYVNRMRDEVAKALEDGEIRRGFAEQGFVPVGSTPAEFAKIISQEIETNRRLAAKIGLEPQ